MRAFIRLNEAGSAEPLNFLPLEENLCFPLLTLFRDGRVIFKDRHNAFPTSGSVYLGYKKVRIHDNKGVIAKIEMPREFAFEKADQTVVNEDVFSLHISSAGEFEFSEVCEKFRFNEVIYQIIHESGKLLGYVFLNISLVVKD